MEDKRVITETEERVFKLCHHDFEGLTRKEAAKQMGVSQSSISRTLARVKAKAPQLFPILNPRQHLIHHCIAELGCPHKEIAEMLGVTVKTIDGIVAQMRAKGVSFAQPRKTVSYESYMDDKIKHVY